MNPLRVAKWNKRYLRGEALHEFVPWPLLPRAVDNLPPGRALDLACGGGRHGLYLAGRGWEVDAVDASPVAIELARAEAERRGLGARFHTAVADLEGERAGYPFPPDRWDLVVDIFFLARERFEDLRRGVRPGGLLVAAIHVRSPAATHSYLLEPGELSATVRAWGWELLVEREGPPEDDPDDTVTAEVVARRPQPAAPRTR